MNYFEYMILKKLCHLFKGTVSRDWGELLMVKIDKTHLFNVAGDGFYSILIMAPTLILADPDPTSLRQCIRLRWSFLPDLNQFCESG